MVLARVCVDLGRLEAAVAEQLHRHAGAGAVQHQAGAEAVAEGVRAVEGGAGVTGHTLEYRPDVAHRHRPAVRGLEDAVEAAVQGPQPQQGVLQAVRERDVARGAPLRGPLLTHHEVAAHVEDPEGEVEIFPAQAEHLPGAQAGVAAEENDDQADDVEGRGGRDEALVVLGRVPIPLALLRQELDLRDGRAVAELAGTPEHRLEGLDDKVDGRRLHVGEPLAQQGDLLLGDLVEPELADHGEQVTAEHDLLVRHGDRALALRLADVEPLDGELRHGRRGQLGDRYGLLARRSGAQDLAHAGLADAPRRGLRGRAAGLAALAVDAAVRERHPEVVLPVDPPLLAIPLMHVDFQHLSLQRCAPGCAAVAAAEKRSQNVPRLGGQHGLLRVSPVNADGPQNLAISHGWRRSLRRPRVAVGEVCCFQQ